MDTYNGIRLSKGSMLAIGLLTEGACTSLGQVRLFRVL
jgi:hypothetical protein